MATNARQALVVEDDSDISELVRIVLRAEDFAVDVAHDGQKGLEMAITKPYNLIILDLMLPTLDGWEICRRLRDTAATRSTPIIMLTAKNEESDKVLGLQVGADDYLTKPFRPREFLARVHALLRRTTDYNQPDDTLYFCTLTIYPQSYQAFIEQKTVDLTPKEFELLLILARNAGRTLKREQLLEQVWGYEYPGSTRTIDEHIKRLRQKISQLEPGYTFVQTVWGVGYKLEVKENDN
ncbi:response regulator transcription factor [Dethiobacter alkaliphilus]|uniref:Two component transcriptional regulator, winged helix family n=1 Tax=Dethiobacter alkaliphilus AHT 1 TaxID=555088 RepID=C0GHG5_DETAL|nr:response regulator transcription factor [Dethiobacter alkaliphilus]EEG77171.1 two component transcriptional regulator, winged helix family [Dethiobacter alkaliphilus AHT 1]